jgi:hypothetical protein
MYIGELRLAVMVADQDVCVLFWTPADSSRRIDDSAMLNTRLRDQLSIAGITTKVDRVI